MIETLTGGLLGSIFGGLFRLAPEVLKWLDRKNERQHEYKMFELQTDLEKVRGEYQLENRYVDHSIQQLDAISEAFKQQGEADKRAWKWVASLSALVRPSITYAFFGLYCLVKVIGIWYGIENGAIWYEVVREHWTTEDFAMLNMILTFWYLGRTVEKR